MFPLLRWTAYFISAKKTFIKNRLGKILDNLLWINMMSVASSTSFEILAEQSGMVSVSGYHIYSQSQ